VTIAAGDGWPAIVEDADPAWLVDPAIFRREIMERGVPVILRGVFRDWPMVQAAAETPAALGEYLSGFASPAQCQAFVGDPSIAGRYYYTDDLAGFNFEREDMPLRTAIDRVIDAAATPGSRSVYVGSLPSEIFLPGLGDDNPGPMLPAGVQPRLWIGTASHVSCHYDTFDNVAAVVAGRRRFTLYPPSAIADLYVGPIDHTMAGQPVGMADGSAPGDPRYPRFEAIRHHALEVELAPGDALYLPKLWWHRVEATAPLNVLINYWWDGFSAGPDAPFTTMLLAMIAIAERPEPERAAWRSFFDHYVFRPMGHPLAHLPESKHGILGSLAQGGYGRIRSFVMRTLRGE
jgi:hypothetical protein